MSIRQRKAADVRRSELVSAAASLFAEGGVTQTAVRDIVKAAGVAQGTFYLYFDSKDAIVCAVAEALIDDVAKRMERALLDPDQSALDKLEAAATALFEMNDEPYEIELMQSFHHPDNVSIHDRVSRSLAERFAPPLTAIIAQGNKEGAFSVENPELAARLVIGALQGLGPVFADVEQTQESIAQFMMFVLRALGYTRP